MLPMLRNLKNALAWVARGGLVACAAAFAVMASAAPLNFTIESPAQGATVDSPVVVRVDTHGIRIGKPVDGLDHLHISVDNGPEIAVYRNEDVRIPLKPGMHVIAVELAGPTHRPLMPPKTVHVLVRG